jgi:cytochrome c-type biogenesis protein CcmF
MLAEVGSILVGLALATLVYAACAILRSILRPDPRWAQSGRNGVYAATGLLGLALALLLVAFLTDQFQIRYVAGHSGRALPLYLKASAVWAGQEGSLLLWAFLQALFAMLVARGNGLYQSAETASTKLTAWATVFLCLIAIFFVAVTLFLSNPFIQLPTPSADGYGLNPLLRHPGMIFHPPTLYLGYVGLAVPFAYAMAALITRRVERWPAAAHRWALAAWLFLGLGLLLGMRWAYDVLGWGGYWGWDPVENAGLMPWLTATALLHSMAMQRQCDGFRWWNMLLAILSFVLVLFGTFATRSGLILSVHAFARSNLGFYFGAFILLTLAGSLILLCYRRAILASSHSTARLLSREGMSILTLVILLTLTGSVWIGSVLPTLTGGQFEAPPAWFDRVIGPQLAALVLLLGICPLLGRVADLLRKRAWPAAVGAVALPTVAALLGFTRPISLIGFAVVGLAGGTALAEIGRRRHDLRRYGSILVHIGVILMALGVTGTRMYTTEIDVTLAPGELVNTGSYTLVYEYLQPESTADRFDTAAAVTVHRNNTFVKTLLPRLSYYPGTDQTLAVPALHSALREDLYLILSRWSEDGGASFKIIVNPLINFLWLGGLILLASGAVALWPPTRVARLPAWRKALATVPLIATLLALAAAGLTMWGIGQTATQTQIGRPAPDFTLDLLDGTTLTLSELRGQIAVVNFWATWCEPCEDELPDLQAIWEEYQERGVTVVGVAYADDPGQVQEMAAEFGVTYLVGLDAGRNVSAAYGVGAIPETFVIDADGRIARVHVGQVSAEQLQAELDELLNQ